MPSGAIMRRGVLLARAVLADVDNRGDDAIACRAANP